MLAAPQPLADNDSVRLPAYRTGMETADGSDRAPDSADWIERGRGFALLTLIVATVIIIGRFTPFSPVQRAFSVFGWVTEQAVDITRELFERWGEPTVFLAPLLENTIFLGALIPGTLVMVLAGVATENGLIRLELAIPLAIAGAIIGDTISYWIGRFGWQRLGPESRLVKFSERIREPLMNHSVWLILSYHFAGYSRLVGPASAGFLRVPFMRWAILDYIGVTLWVITFIMAGYILGVAGLNLDDPSERDIQIFELLLFGLLVIGVFLIFRQASRKQAEDGTSASRDGHDDTAAALEAAADEEPDRVR